MVLKQQERTLEKLLEELQEETVTKFNLALHLFTASWQGTSSAEYQKIHLKDALTWY